MLTAWSVDRASSYSAVSKLTFTCGVDGAVLYHLIRIPMVETCRMGFEFVDLGLPNYLLCSVGNMDWCIYDSRVWIGNEAHCSTELN